jgi:uncharacterized protein YegL
MLPKNSTIFALGLSLITAAACNQASFGGGSGGKRRGGHDVTAGRIDGGVGTPSDIEEAEDTAADGNGPSSDDSGYQPITDTLDKGGWVTKEGFPSLDEALNNNRPDRGDVPGGDGGGGSESNADADSGGDSDGIGGADDEAGDGGSGGSQGDTNSKDPNIPAYGEGENGVFWVPCAEGKSGGTMKGSLRTSDGATIRVAGELCPKKRDSKLNVLFVVDFSGSMEGNPFEGPNDPRSGGSCGRLRAAEALVKKFESDEFKGVAITAGMVAFADDAQLRLPLSDLAALKGSLSEQNWCGALSATARTNYRAAFEQAQAALAGRTGDTVVYFISDGSPTVGGDGGKSNEQAGLEAAQALRQAGGDDLVLNAVFLGYQNGQAQNPQGYLEQVTGSGDRVRVVGGADALVDAIQDLDTSSDKLKKSDLTATHAASGDSKAVAISSLRKSTQRKGAYVWITEPIELVGEVGQTIANTITVKAKTSLGETLQSKAVIDFTLKD